MNNNQKVLREYFSLDYNKQTIQEQLNDPNFKGPFILEGIFQESGIKNQNGRIYPHPILEREVNKYQEFIKEGRAYGALDHPESSVVTLDDACHLVQELYWQGNKLFGKTKILDTTKGKNLKAILKEGGKVGISSRSFGSTTPKVDEDAEIVNEDLQLLAFDIVSSPSVAKAILSEGIVHHKKNIIIPVDINLKNINESLDYIIKNF